MTPEEGASAARLWLDIDNLARATVAYRCHLPDSELPTMQVGCFDVLLLARERAYWRDLALQGGTSAAEATPTTKANLPPASDIPTPPAKRIRQGMSEEQRRAASERMTALRAKQKARGQAAATMEAPITAAAATSASPALNGDTPAERETQATPARMQRLAILWMDPDLTLRDLLAQMNALPGPQIVASTSLYRWAGRLGLPTTRPVRSYAVPPAAPEMIAETAVQSPPDVAPLPAPTPQMAPAVLPTLAPAPVAAVPALPRRPLRPDDIWEEARDMLRAGIPVITVADETGLTTGQVRDLKFGLSNAGKAKGAA